MRAVVYTRISDDRAGEGLGVARQEADCRALADRSGWDVVDVLVDNDRSAYSGKRRPGYEQLLAGLKERAWDVVVAWHPDRLHRSPRELEVFIDVLEASGARVATVMAGTLDLSTAAGRMTARVVGAVARHESEQKSERIRRKQRELAEAGQLSGGAPIRAFGFERDRVTVREAEAVLVREAAQRVLDGEPIRSIVVDWTRRGVAPVGGGVWYSFGLRRMLLSARVAGFREHGGRLFPAVWPAIVDEVTWRRLRALLLDPGRRRNVSRRGYLLTGGLACCGLCGATLVSRPRADKRRAYVCAAPPNYSGCGKIRILAGDFERDVQLRVLARADTDRLPASAAPTAVGPLLAELEAAEARQAELADDYYVHRAVTKAQFQSASAALAARIGVLRSEVGGVERARARPRVDRSVLDGWWDRSLEARRAVLEVFVEQVVVHPAVRGRNFYDEARVEVRWRV